MQESSEPAGHSPAYLEPVRFALAWPLLAVGVLGAAVTASAWIAVSLWEDRIALARFNDVSGDYATALQHGLDHHVADIAKVRAFYDASDTVTAEEFALFTGRLLNDRAHARRRNGGGLTSFMQIQWSPSVLGGQRTAFERAQQEGGRKDFSITRWSLTTRAVPRSPQAQYFPVLFANGFASDESLIGMDIMSDPLRRNTIRRALVADDFAAAQNVLLRGQDDHARGIFVALPVYRVDASQGNGPPLRTLHGVLSATLETVPFLDAIVDEAILPKTVDLYLFPANADGDALPAYARTGSAKDQTARKADIQATPHRAAGLALGDARWDLLIRPNGHGPAGYYWAWLVVVIIGFGFAALLVYMWVSLCHRLRLELANKRILQLAQTDNLTNLANRRAFQKRLKMAFAASLRGAPPFAVLYLDIDNFKDVNDTLGHGMGDELLKAVVARLKQVVRDDDFVARFGGDEFAILASKIGDPTVAAGLASRVGEALAAPVFIDGQKLSVTSSIGIALFSHDVASPEAMMMQADLALYGAKDWGRNCYRFHSAELDRQVHERVRVSDELKGAIEAGEMELYYQPQVNLASGRITGLEALVRWNHKTRGLLRPASFMSIAERTGAVLPLGRWVLDEACRQMKAWQDDGIAPGVLAINVSGAQLKDAPDIEQDIAATLAKWTIDPGSIELELTESVLMEASQMHGDTLDNLRRLGVRIAIDDFGTGYSSLKYLTAYPVNRLKLAQEFVFRVTVDYRNAAVVRAAVRLAHELGLDVLAEGVETEAQKRFLVGAGCEEAQGYYFSQPLRACHATGLLRAGHIGPRAALPQPGFTSAA